MARAMSTVLDVAVCLLLIGAAMTTLAAAPPPADDDTPDADATATTLATATTTVSVDGDRRDHGTYLGLLAVAAVANATLEGAPLAGTAYPAAVTDSTDPHVGRREYVTATWRAYPDAPLRGNVSVGEEPPVDADVAATRHVVDSGVDDPDAPSSRDELATDLAASYVEARFPPGRTRPALVDARTADRTAARYRAMASTLEVGIDDALVAADVESANERLTEALAARLAKTLETEYESVEAAERDVTVAEVQVVVRRWER